MDAPARRCRRFSPRRGSHGSSRRPWRPARSAVFAGFRHGAGLPPRCRDDPFSLRRDHPRFSSWTFPLPIVAVPRALREADPRQMARLVGGRVIGLPWGWPPSASSRPEVFRYAVSVLAFCLARRARRRAALPARPSTTAVLGTGHAGLSSAGSAGLAGPPVDPVSNMGRHARAADDPRDDPAVSHRRGDTALLVIGRGPLAAEAF